MQIYRISLSTLHDGTVLAWAGSMVDAKRAGRDLASRFDVAPGAKPDIQIEDVPTAKKLLIQWLATNVVVA